MRIHQGWEEKLCNKLKYDRMCDIQPWFSSFRSSSSRRGFDFALFWLRRTILSWKPSSCWFVAIRFKQSVESSLQSWPLCCWKRQNLCRQGDGLCGCSMELAVGNTLEFQLSLFSKCSFLSCVTPDQKRPGWSVHTGVKENHPAPNAK